MLEDGKISSKQFYFTILVLTLSASIFILPRIMISQTKQDVWQVMLVAFLIDVIVAVVLYVLGMRYPGRTMIQYSETILGKVLGKASGAVFAGFFAVMGATCLRCLAEFLTSAVIPETPPVAVHLLVLLISAYGVNGGLEVITRLAELLGPVLILSIFLLIGLSLNQMEFEHLQPMFRHNPLELLQASLIPGSWFGICIAMGMFMPYHNRPEQTLKAKLGGVATGVLLLLLVLLAIIAVFDVNLASRERYPIYRLASIIDVGGIFQRLEIVAMTIWVSAEFFTVIVLYYLAVLGFAQVIELKDYRPLTPIIGSIVLVISLLMFRNVTQIDASTTGLSPWLALSVEGLLTTFLLLVSLVRSKI